MATPGWEQNRLLAVSQQHEQLSPKTCHALQIKDLAAQLAAISAEKTEVTAALGALQEQHAAATQTAAKADAASTQALAQAESQKAGLEQQSTALKEAAQEQAKYQQELEGAQASCFPSTGPHCSHQAESTSAYTHFEPGMLLDGTGGRRCANSAYIATLAGDLSDTAIVLLSISS